MAGPVEIWRMVANKWTETCADIGERQWDDPTPCAGWTVRQLVEHNLQWQAEGGQLLGADTNPGDDWPTIRAAYEACLSDPARLDGSVPEFGGIPKHDLAGFLIGDLLIHSWDLARAIGADEALPPDAVEATWIGLQHVPEDLLRGRNPLGQPMMGPAVEVPEGASLQDKMLAYSGRRP